MKVHFLGGADEVGASCLLVESAGRRVLIDAGIRMGAKAGDRLPHLALIDEVGGPDAILVTHAHLDHSGALPLIHSSYSKVPVVTTAPTLSLLRVLLLDALKVMEVKAEQEDEIPLYPRPAVEALLGRAFGVGFLEPVPLCDGALRATFFPAGHVLGAAAIGLETPEGSIMVSGDVSLTDQLTVPGMPRPAFSPDLFVCESTYGSRLHASRRVEEQRLEAAVLDVLHQGGKVLIPAFALGRAQEVILVLRKMLAQKDAPAINVFVDGMVRAVNAVYSLHSEALSIRLRDRAEHARGLFYTSDGRVRPVESPQEREEIVGGPPSVIVASSGMLSGGPSAFFAARLASDEQNLIAITGYQDEESPGRKLQEVADGVRSELVLGSETTSVKCKVATYGLSAHADAQELSGLAATLRPGAVALVHGDESARRGLAAHLGQRGLEEIHLPSAGDSIEVRRSAPSKGARKKVTGIGEGRPFDVQALAELHKQYWIEGRPPKKTFSAHDLAEQWFGTTNIPSDLTPVRQTLAGEQPFFKPDQKRPFLFRWWDARANGAEESAGVQSQAENRLEQNAALAIVDELFDENAGLLRRGADRESWSLRLTFSFPDVARRRYAAKLKELEELTGWSVLVNPEPNLAAFSGHLSGLLPPGKGLVRPPSIRKEEKLVKVRLENRLTQEEEKELTEKFEENTGFSLIIEETSSTTGPTNVEKTFDADGRMEINLTFAEIDRAFVDLPHRPYRKSKKQDNEGPFIMLSFISPEVGLRYEDVLNELEDRTGWCIELTKKVEQQAVLQTARELIPSSWSLRKNPGLDIANRRVVLRLSDSPPPDELEKTSRELNDRTGFLLQIK